MYWNWLNLILGGYFNPQRELKLDDLELSYHVITRWRERVEDNQTVDGLAIKKMIIGGEVIFRNDVRLFIKNGNLCFPCKLIENGRWKVKTVLLFNEMINSKEDIVGRCFD